jgi:hypothetical protein
MPQPKNVKSVLCVLISALTQMTACKKISSADTESAGGSAAVSAFVTREHGYIDTAIGRKHVVAMAARIGIKRLYVNVWSRGCTLFKSNVMKQYGAQERCAEAEGDPLEELVRYGKTYKVEIVPWFEWGNIVPVRSALWQSVKNQGWAGFEESFHTVPAIRINPYKGKFEAFMAALLKEVATKYGSREIHICDNFAPHLPTGAAATALKGPQTFTAFMARVTAPARDVGVRFSLSSQRQVLSLQNFSIDWSAWLKRGIVKWVYPQLYHVQESKTEQFMNEARSERGAGAVGLALYSGPNTDKWSLEGLGRFIKMAKSVGMETALFDINTLLKDEGAFNNSHVTRIANALGTPKRMDLGGGNAEMVPPPAPKLPPPDYQPETPDKVTEPKPPKTKLCEYMKVAGAPEGGVPTYASASKGPIIEYVGNDQLIYRYLTQTGVDGELMMYVRIQTGAAADRIRWLQAKYLVERDPNAEVCEP